MSENTKRREWWITNPPWCWKWTIVSCFRGREKDNEQVVHVKEVMPDDPQDIDEALAETKRLREVLSIIHAEMDSAWNREIVTREHVHRWGEIIRAALAVEH